MRIARIDIDGFGVFANATWELSPGLTVFRGDNEAGKSTLLNAIRALLFGFESTRNGRVWYPALAGGRRGGTLWLVDQDGGRWVVRRHGEGGGTGSLTVEAPSGNQGGAETLERLLRGADRDLFRSIFAFGLTELSDASSMSGDGVHGRIYGAAAGLGGASALDLESDLRERLEELFRPSGQKPVLNALFARMDELRDRITELSRAPDEHAAAHRELADAQAAAQGLRAEADALRARIIRLERSRASAPLIAELVAAEDRLAATDPALDALPPDAEARADVLVSARNAARTRLDDLDATIAGIDADLARLVPDADLLEATPELRALDAERAALAGDDQRRADAAAAIDRHDATIAEQLHRTGFVSPEALLALDDSIPAAEALRVDERAVTEARAQADDARRLVATLRAELAARTSDAADVEPMPPDPEDAAEALRELQRRRRGRRSRPAAFGLVAVVSLAAGIVIATVSASLAAGVVAGAVVLVAGVAWAVLRDRAGEADAELLSRAGFAAVPSDDELERRRDELAVARARLERDAGERRTVDSLRDRLARAENDLRAADHRIQAAEAEWRARLEADGLPSDSTPEVVRQLLAAAGVARRAAAERRAAHEVVARIDARARRFDASVAALCDRLGVAAGGAPGVRLATVLERLDAAARADERRRGLVAQRAKVAAQRDALVADAEEAQRALDEHLAGCGVADAAALHALAVAAAGRRAARTAVDELSGRLTTLAGSPKVAAELRLESQTLDLATVDAGLARSMRALSEAEDAERSEHARIGELQATIRRLEASDELGAARQELAALEGQAKAVAREWAATALAARMLGETRRRYERERQPDVVRAAQDYFRRITEGRYERITAPPGDGTIRVEAASGEQLLPNELSRGTREQLYLSLRFGLIEEFARRAEPLPVVMDDILVNFDAGRAERAADAIAHLATTQQVLFFTCRDETARMLDPSGDRTLALGEPLLASAAADG